MPKKHMGRTLPTSGSPPNGRSGPPLVESNSAKESASLSTSGDGDSERSWSARYGSAILRDGVATIPWALYAYQGQLGLQAPEVWFISAIMARKWNTDLPHPSLRAMAAESGVSLRHLQNLKTLLCKKGLLEVTVRRDSNGAQGSNSYDFGPLFARLDMAILADQGTSEHPLRDDNVPPRAATALLDHSFAARYGRVVAGAGVIAIPGALYSQQEALGLSPQECWFTTYVLAFRWTDTLPYPSLSKMAERTGYSRQALLDIKESMVARQLLSIEERFDGRGGQTSNGYDFSPLLDKLNFVLAHAGEDGAGEGVDNSELASKVTRAPAVAARVPATVGLKAPHITPLRTIAAPEAAVGTGMQRTTYGRMQSDINGGVQSSTEGGMHNVANTLSNRDELEVRETEHRGMHSGIGGGMHSDLHGGMHSGLVGGDVRPRIGLDLGQGDAQHFTGPDAEDSIGGGAEHLTQRRTVQEEEDQEELNDSNRADSFFSTRSYSPYIASVIQDYSNEFGDREHWTANVSQAMRLWTQSKCDETAFVDMLQEARLRLRRYQGRQGSGYITNKMAYYFRVVQSLVDGTADTLIS